MKYAYGACLLVVIAALCLGLFEACRNKGQMEVIGQAFQTNQEITLRLKIRNLDWRVPLSKLALQINTDDSWNFLRVEQPPKLSTQSDVYGPKSQWRCITVNLGDNLELRPGEKIECVIAFSPGLRATNVFDGNVSYLGAVIWEKVGKGQRNAEYFSIPVTKSP